MGQFNRAGVGAWLLLCAGASCMHVGPLAAATPGASGDGKVITAPAIRNRPDQYRINACYPKDYPGRSQEGVLRIIVTIEADGSVSEVDVPPSAAEWMHEAAPCIVALFSFAPGMRDGVPVRSQATLPLTFKQQGTPSGEKLEPPAIKIPAADIIDLYRRCYPSGHEGQAEVGFRITVTDSGWLRDAKIVSSSGDERLDQAGACIMRGLRFKPGRRGGHRTEMTLGWPILVRPPPP